MALIGLPYRRFPHSALGGWRGIGLCRGSYVLAENRLRPFPSAPLRTDRDRFRSISSPVDDIHSVQVVVHLAPFGLSNVAQPVSLRHVVG
jgi:hypothetical protein